MNIRNGLMLLVALVVAVVTALWARDYIAQAIDAGTITTVVAAPEKRPVVSVLVAAAAMPTGHFVQADDLRWQAWPDTSVSPDYVLKGAGVIEDFVGAVVRSPIGGGEPVTEGRLVRPGERGFLAAVLDPGMRATAVKIDATSGVAGFVFPGDRVDVVLTHTLLVRGLDPTKKDREVKREASETVLHDVRVLAIDQAINAEDGQPSVAKTTTLEVTPKQAEMLTLIATMGRLSLSLRSLAQDPATQAPKGTTEARRRAAEVAETGNPMLDLMRRFYRDDGRTFTWDAEVSQLLVPPIAVEEEEEIQVQVGRGSKSTFQAFRRNSRGQLRGDATSPRSQDTPKVEAATEKSI